MNNHPESDSIFKIGVKALIQNSDNQILILHADPVHRSDLANHWDLPGGKIHGNESIYDTLSRELAEETGITEPKIDRLIYATIANNYYKPVFEGRLALLIYLCEISDQEIRLSEEHDQYKWATTSEAANLLSVKYPSEFIDFIEKSKYH